jgi:hypothetical protein
MTDHSGGSHWLAVPTARCARGHVASIAADCSQFGPAGDAELLVDVGEMVVDGTGGGERDAERVAISRLDRSAARMATCRSRRVSTVPRPSRSSRGVRAPWQPACSAAARSVERRARLIRPSQRGVAGRGRGLGRQQPVAVVAEQFGGGIRTRAHERPTCGCRARILAECTSRSPVRGAAGGALSR